MDGPQGQLKRARIKHSIQHRLTLWLLVSILALAVLAGWASFLAAQHEANELQDDTLRQIAELFDQEHLPQPHLDDRGRLKDSDEESRVIVEYLSDHPMASASLDAGAYLPLSTSLPEGLQTLEIEGESFRVLVKTLTTGKRMAVAQETGARDEIADHSAVRTVLPLVLLVPVLTVAVGLLVRTMFKPVALLARDIDQRRASDLHSLGLHNMPAEIYPFVVAINQLLDRVAQSVKAQRRFVADAAHELRSPLAALSLQAERVASADMPDVARERVDRLRTGIDRASHLLNQLLTSIRAQAAEAGAQREVSVKHVYRRVLEDLMPLADAKRIDLGVESGCDACIAVNETDLYIVVKNLVDNAIRYTPEGGRVDLSVSTSPQGVCLQVRDSGPGIDAKEQSRVFDPFYRILGTEQVGSGLGLSIVKTIVDKAGGQVHIGYADALERRGLEVRLLFNTPA